VAIQALTNLGRIVLENCMLLNITVNKLLITLSGSAFGFILSVSVFFISTITNITEEINI
jgi:hypothetical protein